MPTTKRGPGRPLTVAESGRLGGKAGRGANKRRSKAHYARAGHIGGLSGRGDSKRRSPEHYAAVVRPRKVRAAARLLSTCETEDDLHSAAANIMDTWGEDILREALAET